MCLPDFIKKTVYFYIVSGLMHLGSNSHSFLWRMCTIGHFFSVIGQTQSSTESTNWKYKETQTTGRLQGIALLRNLQTTATPRNIFSLSSKCPLTSCSLSIRVLDHDAPRWEQWPEPSRLHYSVAAVLTDQESWGKWRGGRKQWKTCRPDTVHIHPERNWKID